MTDGAEPTSALPIAQSSSYRRLVDRRGQPVWPVCGETDLEQLRRITSLFGVRLEFVENRNGVSPPGEEWVYGLGHGSEGPGRLYAHLTKRQFRHVDQLGGLPEERPAVVVCLSNEVTGELLVRLYPSGQLTPVTGLVVGSTEALLYQQVLVRAAAAAANPPDAELVVDLLSSAPVGEHRTARWQLLGRLADDATVVDSLQAGASVLSLIGHSDGMDTSISLNLVMCSMGEADPSADAGLAPRCAVVGRCHRKPISLSAVRDTPTILAPSVVRARVVIWDTCLSVLLPGQNIDPRWGMLPSLLRDACTGAVLCSFEFARTDPETISALRSRIVTGRQVGDSLYEFHRGFRNAGTPFRLCLFGDPRVRAGSIAGGIPLLENPYLADARQGASEADLADLAVLRALMLARQVPSATFGSSDRKRKVERVNEAAAEVLASIDAYETAALRQSAVEHDGEHSPGAQVRASVLRFYGKMHWTKWLQNLLNISIGPFRSTDDECPHCGCSSWTTMEYEVRTRGALGRRYSYCVTCGAAEEAARNGFRPCTFDRDARTFSFQGVLPRDCWGAWILLTSAHHTGDDRLIPWPIGQDGRPTASCSVEPPWPPGPLAIMVMLAERCRFQVSAFLGRGP